MGSVLTSNIEKFAVIQTKFNKSKNVTKFPCIHCCTKFSSACLQMEFISMGIFSCKYFSHLVLIFPVLKGINIDLALIKATHFCLTLLISQVLHFQLE